MVIISKMDTKHNIYDIYHLNLTMSTNGKVSDLLIIMLITVPLAQILLHILSLFKNIYFNYLKQN